MIAELFALFVGLIVVFGAAAPVILGTWLTFVVMKELGDEVEEPKKRIQAKALYLAVFLALEVVYYGIFAVIINGCR